MHELRREVLAMRRGASEQEVAEVVIAWLEQLGADVYQEVTVRGGIADIVARFKAEIWIVEVKTSLSLALICQAYERRRLCHRIYIAAPHSRNTHDVAQVCKQLGIGLFTVSLGQHGWETSRYSYGQPKVEQVADSRRWNTRPVALAQKLRPEHKTHAKAGAIGAGGRWTPFRDTCEQLARVVREQPGITLKAAIADLRHHYASNNGARSSLAKWVSEGAVDGVRLERGDSLRLFPVERKDVTR